MSGNLAGQTRALPFTGFATLPLVALGLLLSVVGVLMTKVRPSKNVS
jgi:hypothetical protein